LYGVDTLTDDYFFVTMYASDRQTDRETDRQKGHRKKLALTELDLRCAIER